LKGYQKKTIFTIMLFFKLFRSKNTSYPFQTKCLKPYDYS